VKSPARDGLRAKKMARRDGERAGGEDRVESPGKPAKEGAIETLIKKFEKSLEKEEVKPTVSEYIRLKQLRKELEPEKVKEIKVTWVEPTEKESAT
jgi:hypothetical protein